MKCVLIILISLFFIQNQQLKAQAYILDESYKDESFLKFKVKLVKALLNEDLETLRAMVVKEATVNKYDIKGAEGSRGEIEIDRSFCEKALKLISYGFRIGESSEPEKKRGYSKNFYAPSFNRDFPYNDETGFEEGSTFGFVLVLGDDVNVREKPTTKSKVVDQVSYEKVTLLEPVGGGDWFHVKLKNGKEGYIIEDYISDHYPYVLEISKTKSGWKITAFYHQWGGC